jgi:hypothetical protein
MILNREGRPRRTGPASPTILVELPRTLGYRRSCDGNDERSVPHPYDVHAIPRPSAPSSDNPLASHARGRGPRYWTCTRRVTTGEGGADLGGADTRAQPHRAATVATQGVKGTSSLPPYGTHTHAASVPPPGETKGEPMHRDRKKAKRSKRSIPADIIGGTRKYRWGKNSQKRAKRLAGPVRVGRLEDLPADDPRRA